MGSQPVRVVVGDFNWDAKPALAAADLARGAGVVRLQNPATPGAFLSASNYTGITSPGDLAAADVWTRTTISTS